VSGSDDGEDLSYSQAKRRLGLEHVRAARQTVADAERTEPTVAPAKPRRPLTQPPRLPDDPRPTAPRSELAELSRRIDQLTEAVGALVEGRSDELAAAVDQITARYEMELGAHRQTVERLLQRQDAHIETLSKLVETLVDERR